MTEGKAGTNEIKRFLKRYLRTRSRITVLQSEVYQIRCLTEQITVDPTKEKIQSSGSKDRLGDTVARMIDKETEIMKEIARAFDVLNMIEESIQSVDDPDEQLVLQLRYIEGLDWYQTAGKMHSSEKTAQRREKDAFEKLSLFVALKSSNMQGGKE